MKSFKGHKGIPGHQGGSLARKYESNVQLGEGTQSTPPRTGDVPKPIFEIHDARKLMSNFYSVAVCIRGENLGRIIAVNADFNHSYMLHQAGLKTSIDDWVRFTVAKRTDGGQILLGDYYFAGQKVVQGEDKISAMNNIYMACDYLIAAGLSDDTPLGITSNFRNMLELTVHKEIELKSFPKHKGILGHQGGSLARNAVQEQPVTNNNKNKCQFPGQRLTLMEQLIYDDMTDLGTDFKYSTYDSSYTNPPPGSPGFELRLMTKVSKILQETPNNDFVVHQRYIGKDGYCEYVKDDKGAYISLPVSKDDMLLFKEKVHKLVRNRGENIIRELGLPPDLDTLVSELKYTGDFRSYEFQDKLQKMVDKTDLTGYTRDEIQYLIPYYYEWKNKEKIGLHWEDDYPDNDVKNKDFDHMLGTVGYTFTDEYDFQVKHQIALGNLDPDFVSFHLLAPNLARPQSSATGKWELLPSVMYHCATNAGAIMATQLKSRRELGMRNGTGLGGGEDDTISIGVSEEVIKNVERSIHEAHAVVTGKIKFADLLHAMKVGAGANGVPFGLTTEPAWYQNILDMENGIVPEDKPGQLIEKIWDFYHLDFVGYRQGAGGYENPVFFGTDYKALAKLDPTEFKVIKLSPANPNAKGSRMNSMTEWRLIGGDTVKMDEVIDYYGPEDYDEILGYYQKGVPR